MKYMIETFKDIPNYENFYQVSNLGRVKSKSRLVYMSVVDTKCVRKEKFLKGQKLNNGYIMYRLSNGVDVKGKTAHQLVAEAFLNHTPDGHNIVVHHLDNDKSNNNVSNLELITQRDNCQTHSNGTSKHKGVSWNSEKGKWKSQIYYDKKVKHLGYYKTELEASYAYQDKLKTI